MILNELTPSYGGYWNQLDRPIVLGDAVSPELQALLEIHEAMYDLALREMRPGISMKAVNDLTREVAAETRPGARPDVDDRPHRAHPRRHPARVPARAEHDVRRAAADATRRGGLGRLTIGTTATVTEGGARV